MSYILRFTQQYQISNAQVFLELETQFQALEMHTPKFPRGRRYQPLAGGEPTNTLVWECAFDSLTDIEAALKIIADDPMHTELFEKQSPYIVQSRTEIYKEIDFKS